MRAHIIGGTREAVVVAEGPRGPTGIARQDITRIRHPGGAASVVGGLLLGYGVVNIGVGWEECESWGDEAFCGGTRPWSASAHPAGPT